MNQETRLQVWEKLKGKFYDLTFNEESHTYWIRGIIFPSVSSLIKLFYEEFNTEIESIEYSIRRNFELEDVRNAWSGTALLATTSGTRVHIFGEDYVKWKYFGIGERPVVTCKQCLAIIQFWNDLPDYIHPVALELQMYCWDNKFCGTTDIILYNELTGKYIIADYKTNENIFKTEFTASYPLEVIPQEYNLSQNDFGKYTIQLNLYQYLFENINPIKLQVEERWIVWLRDTTTSPKKLYQLHKAMDLQVELKDWLKERNTNFKKIKI